ASGRTATPSTKVVMPASARLRTDWAAPPMSVRFWLVPTEPGEQLGSPSVASSTYLRVGRPELRISLPTCCTAARVGVPDPVGVAPWMSEEIIAALPMAGVTLSGATTQASLSEPGNSDSPHATSLRRESVPSIDVVRSVHLLPVGVRSRMLFERSSSSTISPALRVGWNAAVPQPPRGWAQAPRVLSQTVPLPHMVSLEQ